MFYRKDAAQRIVDNYSLRLLIDIEVRNADGTVRYIPTSVALSHDDADRILGGVDDGECIELVARGNHIALVANSGKDHAPPSDDADEDDDEEGDKDIADHDRKFEVWVEYAGRAAYTNSEVIDVFAGEDADDVCGGWCEATIENDVHSGWNEVD